MSGSRRMRVRLSASLVLLSMSVLGCSGNDASMGHDAQVAMPPAQAASPEAGMANADACAGFDTQLTPSRAVEYAKLVRGAMDNRVEAADVDIDQFLQGDAWTAIHASTTITDPAFFLFETKDGAPRFKDVWGGMVDDDASVGMMEWAKSLGAPEDFAACFAGVHTDDTAPSTSGVMPSPYAFQVDVTLSDAARKKLAEAGESVIVSVSYYGDGKPGLSPKILNEVGLVDIGRAQVELQGEGRATLDGSAVQRERLDFIAGDLQINVNVFSARRSSPDNLLDCGFFQDSIGVVAEKPVEISCQLIAE